MKKNSMRRTIVVSTVFALLAVFLLTPVASAHTVASAHRAATAASRIADFPNVDIVGVAPHTHFSEGSINCDTENAACFTITNLTTDDQDIINGGSTIATIPAGGTARFEAPHSGTYDVSLASNQSAILTVTVA